MWVVSPEDAILSKLEWSQAGESERQFQDALGVAIVQFPQLDWDYLRKWGVELGVTPLLDRLIAEVDAAPGSPRRESRRQRLPGPAQNRTFGPAVSVVG